MDLASRAAQIIRTAKENLCAGKIIEPRFFYDEIAVPSGANALAQWGTSAPDVFKNGEDYPIHITKMMAALRLLDVDSGLTTNERLVQRIGLRLSFHGGDYQDRTFPRLPLWQNKVLASAYVTSFGLSSHKFDVPWVLSARDTMQVAVKLDVAPGAQTTRTVAVAFTGYGLQSQRPYYKAGEVDLSDTVRTVIPPDNFRSDGDEPIVITDMTVHASGQSDNNSAQGDIRYCRVAIQQIGNGTQADWIVGPSGSDVMMPGTLFGTHAGRAIVHEFPSPLIWEPGEGLHAEVQSKIASLAETNVVLVLGFSGSLLVI